LNQEQKAPKKGFLSNIISLGFVSLFTDISSEMVYPLIPDLVKAAGGGAAALGLIEGIAESTANIFKAFSGYISDRAGKRKPLVFLGYLLAALAKPLMGLSYLWEMVLGFRFLDRVGKGVRTAPRDAILADSTGEAKRGQWFGLHRTMDNLGAVAGPLIAAAFLAYGFKLQHLFYWAVIPAAAGLLVIQIFVKETAAPRPKAEKFKLDFRGLHRDYHVYLFISCVFALGTFSNTFLILRAKDFNFALKTLPLLYMVYNIVTSLVSMPAGMLSDRLGRKNLLVFAMAVFGLCYFGFGFANAAWQIWALFAAFGVVDGIKEAVQKALIADLVPSEKRASAYGVFYAATGSFMLPGSAIAGVCWIKLGVEITFSYAAVLALIAAGLLLFLLPNQINASPPRINQ
jgi:MFS family permease